MSLGYDNSRFKDYYDIYVLASTRDFNGLELQEAVKETFEYRKTSFSEIAAFEKDFAEDSMRLIRWKAFVKKKKALIDISLADTISIIEKFLLPIAEAITQNVKFEKNWNHEEKAWIKEG